MSVSSSTEYMYGLENVPALLDKIVVSGLGRTDETLIKKQFRTLAKSDNLNNLFKNVQDAKDRLEKLGVFHYVFAVVDVAEAPGKYRVIFKVAEKNPTTARVSLTHGTDGTSKVCGSVRLNNLLRGAEFADLDLEIGTNQLTTKCATFSKPLEGNPHVRFSIGGTEGRWDHWWAKFLRHERSVFSEIRADSPLGVHKFQWDAAWREVEAKDNSTPWSVRKESGSALKFGLRHTFEHDSRSDLVFPDSGFLFRLSKELASICPGTMTGSQHLENSSQDRALQLRVEGIAHKPFRLTDWLVAELTFSSGFAHSLTGHPVHIADRFFIGGPLDLRGFQWRTVSPMEPLLRPVPPSLSATDPSSSSGEAAEVIQTPMSPIGSEAFWLAGLHLYTPLPYFGAVEDSFASQFRIHGFYLLGSTLESPVNRLSQCVTSASSFRSVGQKLISELGDKSRAAVGAGLVVRFAGLLRIEINYCIPIHSQPGDLTKSGFSFGFGMYYS